MKRLFLILLVLMGAGCLEQAAPTSPLFEQRVFGALGGLDIGESLVLKGPDAARILVGGQLGAADYLLVPFHASPVGSAFLELRISGANVSSAPRFSIESPAAAPVTESGAGDDLHERLYAHMQASTAHLLRRPRPNASVAFDGIPSVQGDLAGNNAFVGQLVQLNANANGSACFDVSMRQGRVEAITDRVIIVADMNNPSGGFTREDYEHFGEEFDNLVYPTLDAHFPPPTDIDGNGRVIVFFTRAVNELTPPGSTGFVGGFFWSRDLFTAAECVASNQGEIFFALVPDPNREASTIAHSRENVFHSALATIGHEYQHLINAGRRIYVNQAEWEEIWLDEGLSHMAEELLFYAATGLAPGSNIGGAALTGARAQAVNRFMRQNLTRYGLYLQGVRRESPFRPEASLETRGATWAFLRYVADHSPKSDREFLFALVDTPLTGLENLAAAIGQSPLEWARRWGVSLYTDDRLGGPDPFLQQPSWHFRSLLPLLFPGSFPLRSDGLDPNEELRLELRGGTSGFVRFGTLYGMVGELAIEVGGRAPPQELWVTLLRVR